MARLRADVEGRPASAAPESDASTAAAPSPGDAAAAGDGEAMAELQDNMKELRDEVQALQLRVNRSRPG